MNKEQLEQEHAHVKEVLAEENDFINSEEYYKLYEIKKRIHSVKKSSLETYLKVLSIELWGDDDGSIDLSPLMWASLFSAAIMPPSFGSSIPSTTSSEEKA